MNWNPNSVSNVICRVTRCIFVYHLPYHKKWICYELHPALAICKFYMLSIKFSYAAAFFSIKTSSKLVPSVSELVWPFLVTFVCFLCLRLFNISSIRPRAFLNPVKCKARFLFCDYLSLLFIDTTLSVLHFDSWSFHPHYCHDQSHCAYLKVRSSGWLFSPAFISPEVFSIPDLSNSVAHLDLRHMSLQIL